jgi:hypothetical protein
MERGGLETWRMVQTRPGTRSGCLSKCSHEPTPLPTIMATRACGHGAGWRRGIAYTGQGRVWGVVSLVKDR